MCKYSGTEGEIRERALQGRRVAGSLGQIMNGRNVSMEVKRDLRNTIIVPTLTYASETWARNESHRSRVQAVERSYLRSACKGKNHTQECFFWPLLEEVTLLSFVKLSHLLSGLL